MFVDANTGQPRQDPVKVIDSLPLHPCMSHEAHETVPRLHLPVAPDCNIHCNYCERKVTTSPVHEICPGVTSAILTPREGLAKTSAFLAEWGENAIVGIAGPGDPLANPETFETISLIRSEHPRARLCLCTNGLALCDSIDRLSNLGVEHLTITINGIAKEVIKQVHPQIRVDSRWIGGEEAARLLIERQLDGLRTAVSLGMHVKVNTVVIPEINVFHVEDVARKVAGLGASVFNPMPLIPRGLMAGRARPSSCHMKQVRARCAQHLPVFERCKQCRADAEGIPGQAAGRSEESEPIMNRRRFLKASGIAVAGSLAAPASAVGASFTGERLRVWSCGGLAEAFIPANERYEEISGCAVDYIGAFAAALGKSLLGRAQTEVFAPRVLELAQKLKAQGRMLHFRPLCFTKYVLITPKGNPAGITGVQDLNKPGVRTVLSPGASPPGGKASLVILKKAGVVQAAQENAVFKGDCVQRDVAQIVNGAGDAAVVEQRISRLPEVAGKVEVIDIPEDFVPGKPIPFVIGIMKWAKNAALAQDYVDFILSAEGQALFDKAGFIPAVSEEGRRLAEKYGVRYE
ncbi:MAG: substrate-binding domain-containing protein [Phycisphaerales bacterium]|nr:MAG: substrate-binding domain-containing protein [Phycisphaerales bacterium]